jgi:fructokinase
MKIISLGEVLWDILPSAEHLGGASFNLAFHAHLLGHEVCFVSALEKMNESGLTTRFIRRTSNYPTGTVSVQMDSAGLPQYHIHRPAAYDFPSLSPSDFEALLTPAPDWICFGTLQQMSASAHHLTSKLLTAASAARHFYDVNLRVDSFTPELVRSLARNANVLKLNEQELPTLQKIGGIEGGSHEKFCRDCARTFDLECVCITRGPEGCALLRNNEYVEAPGFPIKVADTIGAGDAFSAALVHGLSAGWPAAKIADFANRVGSLVASRPGGTPNWTLAEALAL